MLQQLILGSSLRSQQQAVRLACRLVPTCFSSGVATLLQHPDQLNNTSQLKSDELQALAFLLGTRQEVYQNMARGTADSYFSNMLSKLDATVKQALVQKLVAASGIQAVPVLLAWSQSQLSKNLAGLSQQEDAVLQPWYADLLSAAQSWAAQSIAKDVKGDKLTEQQLIEKFLKHPGALEWQTLLGMSSLNDLVTAASASDPMLRSVLQQLGLQHSTETTPSTTPDGSSTAGTAASFHGIVRKTEFQLKQQLAKAIARQADANVVSLPANLEEQAIKQYMSQSAENKQELAVAVIALRLLRCLLYSLGAQLTPETATVLHLLRCQTGSRPARQELNNVMQLDAEHITAAARHCLQQFETIKAPIWRAIQHWSNQQWFDALQYVSKSDSSSPSATLLKRIQEGRKMLLLAGDPCMMSRAQVADLDNLNPQEFLKVHSHAQKQQAAGSALVRQLLGRDASLTVVSNSQTQLNVIWALPEEDREALAWIVLRGSNISDSKPADKVQGEVKAGKLQEVAQQLRDAFIKHGSNVYQDSRAASQAAADLARVIQLERQVAALDLLHIRQPPLLSFPTELSQDNQQQGATLPSPQELSTARSQLPESQILLFDLLHQDMQATATDDQEANQQLAKAFNVMMHNQSSVNPSELLDPKLLSLPPDLSTWLTDVKKQLIGLSPTFLALLSRFMNLRVTATQQSTQEAQQRLKLLLKEVQAAINMTNSDESSKSSSTGRAAVSPYWVSPEFPADRDARLPDQDELPSPAAVAALLGPVEAAQFEAWLRASTLTSHVPQDTQPYEILESVQTQQDIDRYLQMEHDPQLHMELHASPKSWQEAGPSTPPDQFLAHMRPLLDRYLAARGMAGLLDSEWSVYSAAALTEFDEHREQHEAALVTQGHSCFFNSKAEAVYLRQLLTAGIPAGAPLSEQAMRYLTELERNSTWTFVQKKRVVQRLIELSEHFAKHPPPSERGSPFAPLFEPEGEAAPLVPKLKPRAELHS